MTNIQKHQIQSMLSSGLTVAAIARELGLADGTVRSFLRRQKAKDTGNICRNCGKPITQTPGKKKKIFCTSACRKSWWNSHRENYAGAKTVTVICEYCGKEFRANENAHRKYCSRTCYNNHRAATGTYR